MAIPFLIKGRVLIKTIEGLISVKFIVRGNKIFQHFIINNKKGVKRYLTDKRYVVYDKFQEKIKSHALSQNPNFLYIERRDEDDRVVLEFITPETFKKPNNYYFVIPGFVPSTSGCEFCKFRVQDGDDTFFYCSYKEKTIANKLKNCQFFRQDEELFKT